MTARHLERIHTPWVYQRQLSCTVIRVENPDYIDHSIPPEHWLMSSRPIPADMGKAMAVLAGTVPLVMVDYRPRVSRAFKLLHRAVREAQAGRLMRAVQLAQHALTLAARRPYDLDICALAKGFQLDLLGGYDSAPVVQIWRDQANWWTGGERCLSGCLGADLATFGRQYTEKNPVMLHGLRR